MRRPGSSWSEMLSSPPAATQTIRSSVWSCVKHKWVKQEALHELSLHFKDLGSGFITRPLCPPAGLTPRTQTYTTMALQARLLCIQRRDAEVIYTLLLTWCDFISLCEERNELMQPRLSITVTQKPAEHTLCTTASQNFNMASEVFFAHSSSTTFNLN